MRCIFLSSMQEPKARPSAKYLLQHKFVAAPRSSLAAAALMRLIARSRDALQAMAAESEPPVAPPSSRYTSSSVLHSSSIDTVMSGFHHLPICCPYQDKPKWQMIGTVLGASQRKALAPHTPLLLQSSGNAYFCSSMTLTSLQSRLYFLSVMKLPYHRILLKLLVLSCFHSVTDDHAVHCIAPDYGPLLRQKFMHRYT